MKVKTRGPWSAAGSQEPRPGRAGAELPGGAGVSRVKMADTANRDLRQSQNTGHLSSVRSDTNPSKCQCRVWAGLCLKCVSGVCKGGSVEGRVRL